MVGGDLFFSVVETKGGLSGGRAVREPPVRGEREGGVFMGEWGGRGVFGNGRVAQRDGTGAHKGRPYGGEGGGMGRFGKGHVGMQGVGGWYVGGITPIQTFPPQGGRVTRGGDGGVGAWGGRGTGAHKGRPYGGRGGGILRLRSGRGGSPHSRGHGRGAPVQPRPAVGPRLRGGRM